MKTSRTSCGCIRCGKIFMAWKRPLRSSEIFLRTRTVGMKRSDRHCGFKVPREAAKQHFSKRCATDWKILHFGHWKGAKIKSTRCTLFPNGNAVYYLKHSIRLKEAR